MKCTITQIYFGIELYMFQTDFIFSKLMVPCIVIQC